MAFTFDDWENNPFYKALETRYAVKYKEAQRNLWLLCVPCRESLSGQIISKDFVDAHVLKPSPFFKSHFVTTDPNNSITFEIEEKNIKTPSGTVKILMEEIAYNDDYKPYRILTIERPLKCSPKNKDELCSGSSAKKGVKITLNECTTFLLSYPECAEAINLLDKKIQIFNSSYMALPEYLVAASMKLQSLVRWAVKEYLRGCLYTRTSEEYKISEITAALENYIMFYAHDKLFPVVKKFCLEEDRKLTQKLLSLYEARVTPDQLGVRESFCCQTPSAVVELASLNSRSSPVEKLNCLMTTLEHLNKDIEQFLYETGYSVSNKDAPRLTSDDLIPLLVNVIVQARPQYFVSNLYYIQNFCWENSPHLSFGLVTFQAAKEYLKSNDFEFLKPSTRKIKKELSLEELMEVTVEMQNNKKSSVESKPSQFQSPTDHLLENVTKMIEASTKELRDWTNTKESHDLKHKNSQNAGPQENVGDFLSSLRESSLGLSYGKQD